MPPDTLPAATGDTLRYALSADSTPEDRVAAREWIAGFSMFLDEVARWLDEHLEEDLRRIPDEEKAEIVAESGSKVLLTNPNAQPRVEDEAALIAWVRSQPPQLLPDEVTLLDRDEVDWDEVRRAAESDPAVLTAVLAAVPDAKVRRTYLGENAVKALAERWRRYEGEGARRHVAAGPLIAEQLDPETGEVTTGPVPGVRMAYRSQPRAMWRLDSATLEQIAGDLTSRFRRPAVTAGDPA